MLDERHKKLVQDGSRLITARQDLDWFWQEAALHFYPELADITTSRARGQDGEANGPCCAACIR